MLIKTTDFKNLLQESDFVVVHTPDGEVETTYIDGNFFTDDGESINVLDEDGEIEQGFVIEKTDQDVYYQVKLIKSAPKVVAGFKDTYQKVKKFTNDLITEANTKLDESTYHKLTKYQTKIEKICKAVEVDRKKITSIFDKYKKMVSHCDEKNQKDETISYKMAYDALINELQLLRNKYVDNQKKIAEEKNKEAERLLKISDEAIDIKLNFLGLHSEIFENWINALKQKAYNKYLDQITLENYKELATELENKEIALPETFFAKGKMIELYYKKYNHTYHTKDEVDEIINKADCSVTVKFQTDKLSNIIETLKKDIADRIPSKVEELEALKNASELQKKQAKEREVQAQKEREERLAKEKAEAEAEAKRKLEVQSASQKADNMLINEANATLNIEAKEQYKIELLSPKADMVIFAFWFDKEGKNLDNETRGRRSINQMRKFAEKQANEGNFIEDDSVKYVVKHIAK